MQVGLVNTPFGKALNIPVSERLKEQVAAGK